MPQRESKKLLIGHLIEEIVDHAQVKIICREEVAISFRGAKVVGMLIGSETDEDIIEDITSTST